MLPCSTTLSILDSFIIIMQQTVIRAPIPSYGGLITYYVYVAERVMHLI